MNSCEHLVGAVVAVVDDDFRMLESLASLLESAGATPRPFSSAAPVLEDGVLASIDCLVSDICMPHTDGQELKRLAQAACPQLPVILLTAREDIVIAPGSPAAGYQDFFRKPFNGRDLLAAVNAAIRARRAASPPSLPADPGRPPTAG